MSCRSSFNLAPIGSGPYKLIPGTEDGAILGVNLVSNGYYFEGRPFIDEIRFRYYPDESSALDAYQEGAVDGVGSIALADLNRVLNQTGLKLYSSRLPRLSVVFLNLRNANAPILQDADFRKALMAGVNRQGIIDDVYYGQAVLAQGPIMPGTWAFYEDQTAIVMMLMEPVRSWLGWV